ncbi:protein FAM50 homolog [Chironomus tepperi]|uniref:protein FAM50 homolog n=1 Tax=Chironomus tepperi TaxID=113505 RepID=UPI00391F5880
MAQYKGTIGEADRILQLSKQREQQQQDAELQKKKIQEQMKIQSIDSKFSASMEHPAIEFGKKSFGLFTLLEMKAKQEQERTKESLKMQEEEDSKGKIQKKFNQQKQIQKLSFNLDDENDDLNAEDFEVPKKRIRKNPTVNTSFLKDRERDELDHKLKEDLKKQWTKQQNVIRNEKIEVVYSYYDGSGHRFSISMQKGNSIAEFLQACLETHLRKEFAELRKVTNDQLMYIKEDLILPYHYTFYDFIVKKARGKSGPLFQFDVKDDIRMVSDASVEKEESHAGKVVLRSWYERNKHIFPASRWEPYDPAKTYDIYTVKDKKVLD